MPWKIFLFAFSILAGGLLSNTPSSDCLVCDVLTVPWTAGTTSKEPWRALTFCLTKDMYTCNTSQAGMVHHPETLQGPVNNEKTPDQNPPLDQEVLEARVHRLWGCKTPVIFYFEVLPQRYPALSVAAPQKEQDIWDSAMGNLESSSWELMSGCGVCRESDLSGHWIYRSKGASVPSLKSGVVQVGLPDCHQNGQMGEFP